MYLRFETDNDFHFQFYLADQLKISLEQVNAMPQAEYLAWGVYFGRKAQDQQLANRGR